MYLHLGYGNCSFRAYFNAGLTTETFVSVNRLGFTVYHFEYLCRTCCYTFFIARTLVFINNYFKHFTPPYRIKLTKHYECLASLKAQSHILSFCVNIHIMYGQIFVKQKHDATAYHFTINQFNRCFIDKKPKLRMDHSRLTRQSAKAESLLPKMKPGYCISTIHH